MVEYADGAVMAQLGTPDMRLPILYAMSWPERLPTGGRRLDFTQMNLENIDAVGQVGQIDQEVSRIIAEQYERAKSILRQYAEGHDELAKTLIAREVIYTEDVQRIFGPRPWTSRTDELFGEREMPKLSGGSVPPPIDDVEASEVPQKDNDKSDDKDAEKTGENTDK